MRIPGESFAATLALRVLALPPPRVACGWFVLCALGCGTTALSSRGARVVALDATPGPECVELGTVGGLADPLFGGAKSKEELVLAARNDLLNRAGDAGATHVRFTAAPVWRPSGSFGGKEEVAVAGIAYRCGPAVPGAPPAPTGAGCSKDTDCKGERICEAGVCLHPVRAP